ncbi:hypothetical protein J3D54_005280 [Pseudomonas sp. GGS8]|nr:hypothetical protein [Pseudomonas sp. GGS8]
MRQRDLRFTFSVLSTQEEALGKPYRLMPELVSSSLNARRRYVPVGHRTLTDSWKTRYVR